MNIYYFHSTCGDVVTRDSEGCPLPSLGHAQAEARRGAGAIIGDEISAGHSEIGVSVMVEDDAGRTVIHLAVQARVDVRYDPIYSEDAGT